MSRCAIAVCLFFTIALWAADSNNPLLLQQPAVSKTDIVFVFAGDLWSVARDGGEAKRLTSGPGREANPRFSPDGRWVTYSSSESGRYEIYVQSFPTPSAKWQISTQGGVTPRWRDGKEVFYMAGDKLMAVPIQVTGDVLKPSAPLPLFDVRVPIGTGYRQQFDVTPDGQRFLSRCIRFTEFQYSPLINFSNRFEESLSHAGRNPETKRRTLCSWGVGPLLECLSDEVRSRLFANHQLEP